MEFPMHIVAVGGLVVNENDQVLLAKHPHRGWGFLGGQVEVGESLLQALVREIYEESGVIAKAEKIVGIYSNTAKREGYNGVKEIPTIVNVDFVCSYVSGQLETSEESIEVGWFSKEHALKMVENPIIKMRLENMINFKGDFHCMAYRLPFEIKEDYTF